MKINKEGYRIIAVSGLICVAIWLFFYWLLMNRESSALIVCATVFLIGFWGFVVAFFREPRRVRIHDADLVFSPCDGRVVVTEVVMEEEHLKKEMLQISIFMSVTNVHMNWVPVAGEVEYYSTTRVASWWLGIRNLRLRTSARRPSFAWLRVRLCCSVRSPVWWHVASCRT